jgi:RimJ/RimL family protein N-acetyltransferase
MKLSTRRLILRPLALSDSSALYALGSREEVAGLAGFPRYKSPAEARRHVRRTLAASRKPALKQLSLAVVLKSNGEFIGGVSLRWPHDGVGELGYLIAPAHWGRGYAPEAARKLADLAFSRLGAHRVQATCWVKNPRSARVLEKIGMRREGRLRGYLKRGRAVRDEFVWGMTRADWRTAK